MDTGLGPAVPPRPAAKICYDGLLRIGIHTSIAESLESAALKAAGLGANTFQIFSASPRMWRAGEPDPNQIGKLRAARERFDLRPLAIHANYLINLAAAGAELRARSIASYRGEVRRALAIGAEYLVVHPGGGEDAERAVAALVDSLAAAVRGLKLDSLMLLFENTAGGGARLSGRFEELRAIGERAAARGIPVGYCLDTAHALAAGYDIASAAGLRQAVDEIERVLGVENVRLIHANDSKGALGSHLDRHQHIGEGEIGAAGFRRILTHPKLNSKPFILETPRDGADDDRRNLDRLKSLCRKRSTTTRHSN